MTAVLKPRQEPAPEPQNVDEVILRIQSEGLVLLKNKRGQVGNQKTKYADLVQVNDVLLVRLNEYQTIWKCRPHLEDGTFGLHYSLKHVPSGTEETGVWPLKLSDNPQQLGSATTYGRRYALLAVTGVVAEEDDDDGRAAANARGTRQGTQNPPQENPEPHAEPPTTVTMRRRATSDNSFTADQLRAVHAGFRARGITDRAAGLMYCEQIINRPIESTKELTKQEASKVIDALKEGTPK